MFYNDFSQFLDSLDIQDEETADDQLASEKQENTVDSTAEKELMPTASAENEQDRAKHETPPPAKSYQSHDGEEKRHEDKHKGKFVTPTLGEIYAAQGQYAKAISVFETLIKNDPTNDWYQSKLDYLRRKLAEQNN